MSSQLSIYEEMSVLSSRMVDVARAGDWEQLISLEMTLAELRHSLMATNDDDATLLSDDERAEKARLIRRILDDNTEVRQHTDPWMEHVRELLGDATSRHRIANAYGLE